MNDAISACGFDAEDLDEEDIFAAEVTDEVLEAAACAGPLNHTAFTVNLCTVMADCSM